MLFKQINPSGFRLSSICKRSPVDFILFILLLVFCDLYLDWSVEKRIMAVLYNLVNPCGNVVLYVGSVWRDSIFLTVRWDILTMMTSFLCHNATCLILYLLAWNHQQFRKCPKYYKIMLMNKLTLFNGIRMPFELWYDDMWMMLIRLKK